MSQALNEKCHYNGTSSSCEWREDKKEFTILGLSGHKTVLVDKKTNEIYYVNFGSFYKGFGKVEDNIVQYFLEYDGDRLNNYMGELDSITSSLVKTE